MPTQNSSTAAAAVLRLGLFLRLFQPVVSGGDNVAWLAKADNVYSVRSCYSLSNVFHVPFGPEKAFVKAFNLIWKLDVPYKIKTFGWKCFFINRMTTRDLFLLEVFLFLLLLFVLCGTK